MYLESQDQQLAFWKRGNDFENIAPNSVYNLFVEKKSGKNNILQVIR